MLRYLQESPVKQLTNSYVELRDVIEKTVNDSQISVNHFSGQWPTKTGYRIVRFQFINREFLYLSSQFLKYYL